jgi:hypothetical protein
MIYKRVIILPDDAVLINCLGVVLPYGVLIDILPPTVSSCDRVDTADTLSGVKNTIKKNNPTHEAINQNINL